MYQARMPECKPNVSPVEMPERCEDKEEFRWQPRSVHDGDLMMYLRAARSVAAFAGMCDGGSTEDGCQAASMDGTTINAMHMLHTFEYDTGRALQALVKAPALRTIDKKWNEEDTKRFVKGLRVYGKNFFKIRKELLSHRETGELVEYYYFWKKTPAAAANRPHRRHRRHGVKRATTRSQRPASSEFLDLSSGSDSDESEDSDGLSGFRCQNCLVTVSKDWSHAGKPSQQLLCSKCRIFFKKYGVDRPLENPGDSPYFQPVKDGDINGSHVMLTRKTRNSTESKENKKKGTNSVSSLDNLDSPSSDSKKSLVPSSPSALSTCSNSSTDREKKRRGSQSSGQEKKRHCSGSQDKFSKRKLGHSDSESVSDSSISGAEETPNDGDIETNQEELSSSSPPSSPSPVESDYNKLDKSTPVPIPSDSSDIAGKLADLPRPQPQHPSPNRAPLESTPLIPSQLSPGGPLKSPLAPGISQLPSQGFVPLPPLPAFRPKLPEPHFPLHSPYSDSLSYNSSLQQVQNSSESSSSVQCSSPFQQEKTYLRAGSTDRSDGESREATSVISGQPTIKEEVVTPPPSPSPVMDSVFVKQEPTESVSFMSKQNQNGAGSSVQPGSYPGAKDMYGAHKDPFELLTPKIEPGLLSPGLVSPNINPKVLAPVVSSVPPSTDSVSKDRTDSTLTLQAEVKGQSQGQGDITDAQDSERSEIEIMEDSDSDREGTTTPGPTPTPCNKEIHRSKSAIFIKLLNRGEHNSCSRCDLMFKPLADSKLAQKRADREKKGMISSTPAKEEPPKRKTETPPPNSSADAHIVSSIPPPSHHGHQDRVTPRSYQDTPALRQLSEYAKPHAVGQDPRSMQGYLGFSPFMDPIRMAAMYPPNSRERLELELERDKRERDAREREIREQELRSMEMREKLKAELEMKPPGLERLMPPGAGPLDPHWLEIQRRYGPHMMPGSSPHGGGIPGIYPPTSIASDLMVRERERLERLGIPTGHPMLAESSYAAVMERLSAERISAERLSAERLQAERQAALQDPMFRLQMSAAAAQHAQHQHTHAHSHTHLHLHQPDLVPPPPGGPPPPPSGLHHPMLQYHPLLHGADPMSGVNGAGNNQTPPVSMVGMPPHLLSREQELLQNDLYRRAYADPALAQQLQHEALQRMVLDRERFGSGHLPPPH